MVQSRTLAKFTPHRLKRALEIKKFNKDTVLVSNGCCNNYHKLCDLKKQKFIILQLWRSKFCNRSYKAKIKVLTGLCSLRRLCGTIHSLPFVASRGCPYSLAHGCLPLTCTSIITSPSLSLPILLPL